MVSYNPQVPYNTTAHQYSSDLPYDGFSPAPGDGNSPWKIELAIDLAANGVGDFFTLDDPVKGVLDNATYLLAGEVLVDITGWVRSVDVKRGRSRVLEKFTAGSSRLTLDNRERLFDPLMTSSPFYGSIIPRKQIVISNNNVPVYQGNVQDWDFSYNVNGDATAEPSSSDGFAFFAQSNLAPGTATGQLSGARVNDVLDELSWPDGQRDIDTGLATLAADIVDDNQNALSYLQKVETTENGAMFIGKNGKFTFRDSTLPSYSGVEFGNNGIPFIDYQVAYGVDELWNKVNIVWSAGTAIGGTVTVENTVSQGKYGVFEVTYDTLLAGSATAAALGSAIVATYAEPKYRIDQITVLMNGVTSQQELDVLSLELADAVLVSWQNFGPPITQYCIIDGIEHKADTSRHTVTFTLSETTIA